MYTYIYNINNIYLASVDFCRALYHLQGMMA